MKQFVKIHEINKHDYQPHHFFYTPAPGECEASARDAQAALDAIRDAMDRNTITGSTTNNF